MSNRFRARGTTVGLVLMVLVILAALVDAIRTAQQEGRQMVRPLASLQSAVKTR